MASTINLEKMLQSKGVRSTRQRLAIAEVIAKAESPIGANAIWRQLNKQKRKIGIATIYRVLALFEKNGMVARQPQVGATATFHYALATSDQLGQVVCSRCGKVEEIERIPGLENLRKEVSRNSQFATTDQSLYIIADCRNDKCDN